MLTGTVRVDFAVGGFVAATIGTEDVLQRVDVTYSGAVDRLPEAPARTSWALLRLLFEKAAGEQDGRYSEKTEGFFILPDVVLEANEEFED